MLSWPSPKLWLTPHIMCGMYLFPSIQFWQRWCSLVWSLPYIPSSLSWQDGSHASPDVLQNSYERTLPSDTINFQMFLFLQPLKTLLVHAWLTKVTWCTFHFLGGKWGTDLLNHRGEVTMPECRTCLSRWWHNALEAEVESKCLMS